MAISKEDIKKMTGQEAGDRTPSYKLNEVTMSGDSGEFRIREILAEKNADGKYNVEELGKELNGVVLKMRWRLSRYEEDAPSINTTEYDNKYKDTVTVFPSKEKGNAANMKEKYNLTTQRVIYFYLPGKEQIVRLIVKASALTGDKNPNGEQGLFEYVDEHNDAGTLIHEYITTCKGVHRPDPKGNKRKDYIAMSFACGRPLTDSEKEKVEKMIVEVHEKTANPNALQDIEREDAPELPELPDNIREEDIPF